MAERLPPDQLGFRIDSFLDLAGWRVLTVPPALLSTAVTRCPADNEPLHVLCTLTGDDGHVRIGCCSECGHVTFIDRPSRDWLDAFYLGIWDGAIERAANATPPVASRKPPRLGVQREAVNLALSLPVDRSRPVCEIGSGHGHSLRHLELAGFSRLVGVEPSEHRAAVARRSFGYDIASAPFEATATQDSLRRAAPYSIIYSIHALEHTYDPLEVLRCAASLQDTGDYLVISVPNLEGEPSVSVLMFIAHAHAFTPTSLQRVAARAGYTLVDCARTTSLEITAVFRKAGASADTPPNQAAVNAVDKVIKGLHLNRHYAGANRLHWSRKSDWAARVGNTSSVEPQPPEGGHGRTMLVSPLEGRRTDATKSPIEIQFRDGVKLFYK